MNIHGVQQACITSDAAHAAVAAAVRQGIGVSGGSAAQDEVCAGAGLAALGLN